MPDIAPLSLASNALDTFAKWARVMERAGVTYDQLVLPINSRTARRNLAEYLKAGCPKLGNATATADPAPLTGYDLASIILGKDFIRPDEVAANRPGVVYSDEQFESFENMLPGREELEELRDDGYMLVPGPAQPMALLDIRSLKPGYFYTKTGGWYAEEKQRFSREDRAPTKWLKLRKGPVPNSTGKNWDEQSPLLSAVEHVPNDAEVEWAVTTYKAVRGIYLLPNVYVRTSSRTAGGSRVDVGRFDAEGLDVNDVWGDGRFSYLGLASARE